MTAACLSCHSTELHENERFRALPRVTSDHMPFRAGGRLCVCLRCGLIQKPVDAAWKKDIAEIYGNYHMYALTGGADQVLFSEGTTRAGRIAEILGEHLPPDFSGAVIDIGCGTGGFLKAFGEQFPRARLYGKEIDAHNLPYLQRIPGFQTLFTSADPLPGQAFDVITSIHCFEHVFDYRAFFDEISQIGAPGAQVLLQVPDVETSAFDIVIADHAAHFSQATLTGCLRHYGQKFNVQALIPKELTALPGSGGQGAEPASSAEEKIRALDTAVEALCRLLEHIDTQAGEAFGVYGTTIAAGWLTAAYKEKVAFYVEDDPLKQGKNLHGKEIISPAQAPAHCKVVLPFAMTTVQRIFTRHPHLIPLAICCESL